MDAVASTCMLCAVSMQLHVCCQSMKYHTEPGKQVTTRKSYRELPVDSRSNAAPVGAGANFIIMHVELVVVLATKHL